MSIAASAEQGSCEGLVFQVSGAGALTANRSISSSGLVPKTSSAFNRHLQAVSNTYQLITVNSVSMF